MYGVDMNQIDLSGFHTDQSFTFDLVVYAGQPMQIAPEVEIPQGFQAKPCGDLTCLYSWNAQTGVDHFNVYAAQDEDPYFTKIGFAPGIAVSHTTNDKWSGDASTKS